MRLAQRDGDAGGRPCSWPAPSGPRLVYRGRIDDRYVDFGTARAAPTTRDLEQVLDAIVAGEAVPLADDAPPSAASSRRPE